LQWDRTKKRTLTSSFSIECLE